MDKKDLRIRYKNFRDQLNFEDIMNDSLAIANQCLALPIWDKNYFHIFLPIEKLKEINTEFLLQILAGKDKEILISKSNFDTQEMTHFLLTDNTKIKTNTFGIPEPVDGIEVPVSKIDVVFVPLLAYDAFGNRVGYGKGFYDKFLQQCNPNVIKIGLSFFDPEPQIEGITMQDATLDYCITPDAVYEF